MSIAALANDELLRTNRRSLDHSKALNAHLEPALRELKLEGVQAKAIREAVEPIAAENPVPPTPPSSALDGLVKYIPTESITLYVAATSSLLGASPPSFITAWTLYIGFAALTPVLFLLIYMGKRRSLKQAVLPESPLQWPWWKLFAATVAFLVWALAVPPLITGEAGKVMAAFGALLVSTLLNLVGGVVEPAEAEG